MAGDWIKMRVSLTRDPRVIRMADWLAEQREFMNWLTDPVQQSCDGTAYSHVTRHVTIALCVTALLVTWGTAREQGDRDGEDLVLTHCDLDTISAMSDLPCFGRAMESVEWAVESGNGAVIFPKFFRDNESPDEKHKRQAAERQAKKREKDRLEALEKSRESNVTCHADSHVTVTHREEKRREEKTPSLTDSNFAEFWSAYPRKESKADALKAFLKLKPDADLFALILAGLQRAKDADQWIKDDGKFIPHASTWLNKRRWEDEGMPATVTQLFAGEKFL
jgi:hypothetical protein